MPSDDDKGRNQQWTPVSKKPKDRQTVWVLVPSLNIGGKFVGWCGYLAEYDPQYEDFESATGMREFESEEIEFWKSANDLPSQATAVAPLPEPPVDSKDAAEGTEAR